MLARENARQVARGTDGLGGKWRTKWRDGQTGWAAPVGLRVAADGLDGTRPTFSMDGPRPTFSMDGPRPTFSMDGPRPTFSEPGAGTVVDAKGGLRADAVDVQTEGTGREGERERWQMKDSKNSYRDRLSKIATDAKRRSTEGSVRAPRSSSHPASLSLSFLFSPSPPPPALSVVKRCPVRCVLFRARLCHGDSSHRSGHSTSLTEPALNSSARAHGPEQAPNRGRQPAAPLRVPEPAPHTGAIC